MRRFQNENWFCPASRAPIPREFPEKTVFRKPPVDMSWHHIVPYSQLRNCWNTLAAQFVSRSAGAMAVHTYMRLLGYSHETAKKSMNAVTAGRFSADDHMKLWYSICYPKWDLVEGPSERVDDPDEDFDEFKAGLSSAELVRQDRLRSLHTAMKTFNEASVGLDEIADGVIGALHNVFGQAERTLLSCKAPISFRESMWKEIPELGKSSSGKWRKASVRAPGSPPLGA